MSVHMLYSPNVLLLRLFEINNYPNYGNCFTFNSAFNRSGSRSYVTSLTAPNFGLYLVLQLDQKNYLRKGMTKQVRSM